MRILSDFDGVWTDQRAEARFIQVWLADAVAAAVGLTPDEALADFDTFWDLTLAEPGTNGWAPDGRITGFVDEDVLLSTGAVSHWIELGGAHPRADAWRDIFKRAGIESMGRWVSNQFGPAMAAYQERHHHGLVPGAAGYVQAILDAGHELFFVSNSNQNKLESMLGAEGFTARPGLEIIGAAGKWMIGEDEPKEVVGGRAVHLDRPQYRAILERIRPDLVIGDVASFDLALPAYMRWKGELDANLKLWLRRNADTSPWALAQPTSTEPLRFVDHVVDGVGELLG